MDIALAGEPQWLVATPSVTRTGSLWVVVLTDGRVQAFEVTDSNVEMVPTTPAQILPGMPPYLHIQEAMVHIPSAPVDAPSATTHPLILNNGRMVFIHAGGDLIFWDNGQEINRLSLNVLPDARILVDEQERLLLLTEATTRYRHGVLGDQIEAAAISLIKTAPAVDVELTIPIPEPTVVEGIAPIWADLNGDGQREIIVTLSNADQGAQLVVFNEQGEQIAAGPAIGQGNRWRHQLAVAPFGSNGELELVDVLTPHLGRVTEFFRLEGDTLQIVAQVQAGYTSHAIGSRNLDMAVAGDFDGDGQTELLLPNTAGNELGAIRRTPDDAEVVWTLPIGGRISTNLAAISYGGQGLALGVGQTNGVLRLWLP